MPKVIVNQGTATEYSRLDIIKGSTESIILKEVHGYGKSLDKQNFTIHNFRFEGGQSLVSSDLPLSNNPREPGESKAVKAMKKTLEDQKMSKYFHLLNNGMTIIAKNVNYSEKKKELTITFDHEKQGVCNGGHTYYAIKRGFLSNYIKSKFFVNAEVIVLPTMNDEDKKKMTIMIAKARNFSNPIKEESLADAAGFFEPIKKILGEKNQKLLSYHENDSEAVEGALHVKHFLRTLASLSPTIYGHDIFNQNGTNHKTASVNDKSKIWKPWVKQNDEGMVVQLKELYPLSLDVMLLRDEISRKILVDSSGVGGWKNHTRFKDWVQENGVRKSLVDGGTKDVQDLPVTLEPLLIGLLRNLIHVQFNSKKQKTMIGWYKDPIKWLNTGANPDKLTQSLNKMAPDMKDIDPVKFKTLSSPYEKMMITWDESAKQLPDSPTEIIYDINGGTRYELVGKKQGTHRIDNKSGLMVTTGSNLNYIKK